MHLRVLENENYFVSEKADGTRYLLLCVPEASVYMQRCFLIDRKYQFHFIPNLLLHGPDRQLHQISLMDGELVSDQVEGSSVFRFLVFDLLVEDEANVCQKPLTSRLGRLKAHFIDPLQPANDVPFTVELKHSEISYGLKRIVDSIPHLKHGNDGLLFTSVNAPYKLGTCDTMLKWKPNSLNSIDFKLNILNTGAYRLLIATSRGEYQDYGELKLDDTQMQMQWQQRPPHGAIVECVFDPLYETKWRFMRFRDDKDTPNHISIVPKIMESIEQGVSIDTVHLYSKLFSDLKLTDAQYLARVREKWKQREQKR